MNLLVCDIGNTSIKIGWAQILNSSQKLCATYVFPTRAETTADSLGLEILSALRHCGLKAEQVQACVACSVVPYISQALRGAVKRYLDCPCFFAMEDLPIPLENQYARPSEVGADILIGCYAARKLLPNAPGLIVVDYGTAATFACVKDNAFLGGLIFPGPATAASALSLKTAKLPHISLDDTVVEPVPGKDTATCIRHGLIFGYVAVTEGLCQRLAKTLPKPVTIVATGGFSSKIGQLSNIIDKIEPDLLLSGLVKLYLENAH